MIMPNPIDIIDRDFKALTRKVTAHHILLPKSDDVALSLKQKIRNKVNPAKNSGKTRMYIVDAFELAAKKFSRDEETAINGGLLGTLVPQGYCRAPELDKACFEVPLGEISGPIESDYGYHLLLVTERTNCPKLDGDYNKIERGGEDGTRTVFVGDQNKEGVDPILKLALQQVGFWIAVSFAGGIVAEVAAKAANVLEKLPWEQ
jgi:parvulin-like peptidyl-prolyl isomerase